MAAAVHPEPAYKPRSRALPTRLSWPLARHLGSAVPACGPRVGVRGVPVRTRRHRLGRAWGNRPGPTSRTIRRFRRLPRGGGGPTTGCCPTRTPDRVTAPARQRALLPPPRLPLSLRAVAAPVGHTSEPRNQSVGSLQEPGGARFGRVTGDSSVRPFYASRTGGVGCARGACVEFASAGGRRPLRTSHPRGAHRLCRGGVAL